MLLFVGRLVKHDYLTVPPSGECQSLRPAPVWSEVASHSQHAELKPAFHKILRIRVLVS